MRFSFRAVQSILRTYFGKMLFRYVNIGAITLQLRTYMRKSLLRYVNFLLIMHFRSACAQIYVPKNEKLLSGT